MGRSIATLRHSNYSTYFEYPKFEFEEDEDGNTPESEYMDSDEFKSDLVSEILYLNLGFHEVSKPTEWDEYNDEVVIILRNNHCEIGISEYCGLVSLGIRVNVKDVEHSVDQYEDVYESQDSYDKVYASEYGARSEWIDNNWETVRRAIGYTQYSRQGGFSDGTSVYSKIEN